MNYRPIGTYAGPNEIKKDDRPMLGPWAPGNYLCHCLRCGGFFLGGLTTHVCADCAYKTCDAPAPSKPTS
jgi:hypothetical protein